MYRNQIQEFKSELDKRRLKGDFTNNELIYCSGVATIRVIIKGKSYQAKFKLDQDNVEAIKRFNNLINKAIKNVTNTNVENTSKRDETIKD